MFSYRIAALFCMLLALMLFSCDGPSEDSDDSGGDNDQDGTTPDDDVQTDDDQTTDDDSTGPLDLQIYVDEPFAGNPLARRLRIYSNVPCSLSGFATTDGEPGRSPSSPRATATGTYHALWFYGLLAESAFNYTIFLADQPDAPLAVGEFETPSLPNWAPKPIKINNTADAAPDTWVAMLINSTGDVDGDYSPDRVNLIQILDREGRARFFHNVTEDLQGFMEGLTVLSNGDLAWSNRSDVVATGPTGVDYLLFDVQLDEPCGISSHHQGYYWLKPEKGAITLFNLKGPGVECDLTTPTENTVADGVAWLDETGQEIKRWTFFDVPDAIPPELQNPCNCDHSLWGPGTYDFSHANSVFSVDDGAAVLISSRNLSRIIKVDAESGEVIWQLGKDLDFTWISSEPEKDRWFYLQHDARWLPNNHLLVFDNSSSRYRECWKNPWSRGLELEVDEEAMTVRQVWEHRVPYSAANGSVTRLSNGNTLIAGGWNGVIVEAAPDGREVWSIEYLIILQLPDIYNARPYRALWDYEN